jgi:CheY-like chemotaxis protein
MRKILVVDDDAALRGVIGLALQAEGYEVLEAEDGAVAIQVRASSCRIWSCVTSA